MKTSLIKTLNQRAHSLKPIILIGSKGLTEAVHSEIDRALNDHELIKIRFQQADREERKKLTEEICTRHQATLIKSIGRIITIYRERQDDKG